MFLFHSTFNFGKLSYLLMINETKLMTTKTLAVIHPYNAEGFCKTLFNLTTNA